MRLLRVGVMIDTKWPQIVCESYSSEVKYSKSLKILGWHKFR